MKPEVDFFCGRSRLRSFSKCPRWWH